MKITISIIIICILVFIAQSIIVVKNPLTGDKKSIVTEEFSLTPNQAISGHVWQFVTYMFLHGEPIHLFLNMFVLLIFGVMIENTLGRKKYLLLFFISGIASSAIYLIITGLLTPPALLGLTFSIPMLGASGAVFGVMAAYGLLYPKNWIIMFPGIPMPAWVAVIAFAGLEVFYGLTGAQPGVANWGHLGGLLIGAILILYWKKKSKRYELLIEDSKKIKEDKEWEFVWE